VGAQPEPPLVVKIGGSLAKSGRLRGVLDVIAAAKRPVVVVPGGGAFADAVRDQQRALGLGDAVAHRIAMLAMHQTAEIIVALNNCFAAADSIAAVHASLGRGHTPVWLPLPMMEDDEAISADWSTTSDSLAARLAELLGGAPLALLKSVDVDPAASAEDLARDGIVDAAFPGHVARSGIQWRIYGPSDDQALGDALAVEAAATANY
jgi:aspartokinase-like uncharacterized kinase